METDAAATVYRNAAGKLSYNRTCTLKESILTTDTLIDALSGYVVTRSDGTVVYRNAVGQTHRIDGPAVVDPDGSLMWYRNNRLHRVGGPTVIHSNGEEHWYQNGDLHRLDGPAIIRADGSRAWYQYDKLHRTDGPAVVRADGSSDWFLRGTCMSYKDFQRRAALEDCHDT